jgi:hypothetical protein
MSQKLKAQYPLGEGIAVYKVENPAHAHQLFKRFGLWESFKADSGPFNDVEDQEPAFLGLYRRNNLFVLVHFRLLWNDQNPGWALFIVFDSIQETLAEQFANALFDKVAAKLLAEPDTHIHIQKER